MDKSRADEIKTLRRQIADLEDIITECRQVIEPLKESEQHYRLIAENTPAWVFWLDADDKLIYVSPSCRQITGYTPEEFHKDKSLLFKIIHSYDRSLFEEHRRLAHRTKSTGEEDFRIVRKDGQTRWINHVCRAVHTDDGEFAGIVSHNRDITEQKTFSDRLEESEKLCAMLADHINDVVWTLDTNSLKLTYVSPSVERFRGYTANETLRQNLDDMLAPGSFKAAKELLAEELALERAGGSDPNRSRTLELEYRRKDGSSAWMECRVTAIRDVKGAVSELLGVSRDITGLRDLEAAKLACEEQSAVYEKKQKSAEARLRAIMSASADGLILMDTEGKTLAANETAARYFGTDSDALLKKRLYFHLLPHALVEKHRKIVQDVQKSGKPVRFEETLAGKSLLIAVHPVAGPDGRIAQMLICATELTDRKNAEAAVEESRQKMSALFAQEERRLAFFFEKHPAPMLLLDPDRGVIADATPAACAFYGWKKNELAGRKMSEINILTAEENLSEMRRNLMGPGAPSVYKHRLADGTIRDVMVAAGPMELHGKTMICAVITDITERLRMENSLKQAEGPGALGILAGGIARDFNNLMTIVQGYIDVALLDVPENSVIRQSLRQAQDTVEKTRAITGRLLQFSQTDAPQLQPRRIDRIIADTVTEAVKSESIELTLDIPRDLWPVAADENRIRQCLRHLAENAQEAMPGAGKLSVFAENVELHEADDLPLNDGPYVKVSVSDTGQGIPRENLSKIFDPFFSTKTPEDEKRLGLGLALCHAVVNQHGGYITAESEEGQGARFIFYLPARPDAEIPQSVEEKPPVRRRLLIMDDDEDVRKILRLYAEQLGYETQAAAEGQEAIRLYREALDNGSAYDAVLMELSVKQGLGGEAALPKLLGIDPAVKAVAVLSNYDASKQHDFNKRGFAAALGKPFRLDDVRRILQGLFAA
mgnify:FL=1